MSGTDSPSSTTSTDPQSPGSRKQTSEMLQRWKVESQKDKMAYHEWLIATQVRTNSYSDLVRIKILTACAEPAERKAVSTRSLICSLSCEL